MKHWKFRATAIVVIVAALLTGSLSLVNEKPAQSGGASELLARLAGLFTGGAPAAPADDAPAEVPAQTEPAGAPAETATPAPTETPAPEPTADPGGAEIAPEGGTPAPEDNAPILSGSVDIAISNSDSEPGGGEQNRVANVQPNQRIPKDFHVTNNGSADACVFMAVTVPYVVIATQQPDGTLVSAAAQPLYTFRANPGWILLADEIAGSRATYIYAYASGRDSGGMTALRPGQSTPKLFDELITANYVEGSLEGATSEVVAQAYAIQATDLGDATTPAAIWQLVRNGR